jgi:hypothetical protein
MKTYLFLIAIGLFLLSGCSSRSSENSFRAENEQTIEIENPYSPGTGHYAGYEWAERTGGDCNGNSNSFNEGCEEYYRQISSSGN